MPLKTNPKPFNVVDKLGVPERVRYQFESPYGTLYLITGTENGIPYIETLNGHFDVFDNMDVQKSMLKAIMEYEEALKVNK